METEDPRSWVRLEVKKAGGPWESYCVYARRKAAKAAVLRLEHQHPLWRARVVDIPPPAAPTG